MLPYKTCGYIGEPTRRFKTLTNGSPPGYWRETISIQFVSQKPERLHSQVWLYDIRYQNHSSWKEYYGGVAQNWCIRTGTVDVCGMGYVGS